MSRDSDTVSQSLVKGVPKSICRQEADSVASSAVRGSCCYAGFQPVSVNIVSFVSSRNLVMMLSRSVKRGLRDVLW